MSKRFKVGDWVYLDPMDRINKLTGSVDTKRGVVTKIIREFPSFQDVMVSWEDGSRTGAEADWLLLV